MHASIRIPFVSLQRPLNVRQLLEARALAAQPPGWAAIFVKAFSLVAREEPVLRTLYAKWPWPSLYELPRSIAMIAIARVEDGEDCVLPQKIIAADALPFALCISSITDREHRAIENVSIARGNLVPADHGKWADSGEWESLGFVPALPAAPISGTDCCVANTASVPATPSFVFRSLGISRAERQLTCHGRPSSC